MPILIYRFGPTLFGLLCPAGRPPSCSPAQPLSPRYCRPTAVAPILSPLQLRLHLPIHDPEPMTLWVHMQAGQGLRSFLYVSVRKSVPPHAKGKGTCCPARRHLQAGPGGCPSPRVCAGAAGCSAQLLQRPQRLTQLLEALAACFVFDRAAAPLALHMRVADGGGRHLPGANSRPHAPPVPALGVQGSGSSSTGACVAGAGGSSAEGMGAGTAGVAKGQAAPKAAQPACVLLPRMPLCTLHLGSVRVYEAVADVARSLGHLARLADAMGVAGRKKGRVPSVCNLTSGQQLHAVASFIVQCVGHFILLPTVSQSVFAVVESMSKSNF